MSPEEEVFETEPAARAETAEDVVTALSEVDVPAAEAAEAAILVSAQIAISTQGAQRNQRISRFVDALATWPPIAGLAGRRMARSPGFSGVFDLAGEASVWALNQAKTRSPTEVVEQLERFLTTNRIEIHEVLAISGLVPAESYDLGGGVSLVPLSEVPQSRLRDHAERKGDLRNSHPLSHALPTAGAALLRKHVLVPFPPVGGEYASEFVGLFSLSEVLQVLPACAERPLQGTFTWFTAPSDTPFVGTPLASWHERFKPTSGGASWTPEVFPVSRWTPIIAAFSRIKGENRSRIGIALNRLNDAMLDPHHTTQCALDLGIAAEALLTTGEQSNESISYAVRQRAALLLSKDIQRQQRDFALFKALYELRSAAAHGRVANSQYRLLKGQPKIETVSLLREAAQRICALVRALLLRAAWPDWDAFVMGWESGGNDESEQVQKGDSSSA